MQDVLYRSAKQDRVRRFHALYDKVARSDILARAFGEVRANHGAPGVDGQSVDDIVESGVESFLDDIAQALKDRTYRPAPLRRVEIPKAEPGKVRVLGIPTCRDRVIMTAAKMILEPIWEADFLPASFGYRPGRSTHDALEAARVEANRGADWVVEADVSDAFGSLDHEALMAQVARRVCDRQMLKLIRSWLRMGVLEGGVATDPVSGIAQGSPISPLLCNIALHVLDEEWTRQGRTLGKLVRYADDAVAICATRHRAEQARRTMAAVLRPLGLELNPDKTRIVCLTNGGQGLDFLGFHLHKVQSWRRKGRWYLQRWPSARNMAAMRAKIRSLTDRRFVGFTVAAVVDGLNRVLRAWGNHFRYGNSSAKFSAVDRYVHERLAIFMGIKHGLAGSKHDHMGHFDHQWFSSLGVYRLAGTVRYGTAHAGR